MNNESKSDFILSDEKIELEVKGYFEIIDVERDNEIKRLKI